MEKYGTKQSHFTKIAAKNKRHSVNNPYSQFRIEMTEEQVKFVVFFCLLSPLGR